MKTFLSKIEPDKKAVRYAHSAHESVREFLEDDEDFGQFFEDSFLYGSYKRHTAVGDIKDVDIVVLTNFDPESEEHTPQKVLRKLKDALARYYEDPENPEYQRRSIRINQPLPDNNDIEMTLDIIPAVANDGDHSPLLVPDREVKEWISSRPKGHLEYTSELNKPENSNERFVPLVKLMKWWWKYQCEERQPDVERPKPKGFWVEILTGENFDSAQYKWADHFIAVLENISEKYSDPIEVPELHDPGIPEEKIKTSMDLDEFRVFMQAVNESLEMAKQAISEEDNLRSSELWRDVFGNTFPLYDEEETETTRAEASTVALGEHSHAEPVPWPDKNNKHFKVSIDAYLHTSNRKIRLGGINSDGMILQSGLSIKYVAKTNVLGNYKVYWQVVNTGNHARNAQDLRGQIFPTKSPSIPLVHWEQTKYTGKHWIECFIVKDGKLVARSGRFCINIKNSSS